MAFGTIKTGENRTGFPALPNDALQRDARIAIPTPARIHSIAFPDGNQTAFEVIESCDSIE